MFTLIDRQLIRGYFKSYLVCLVSLLSLYVVVDLFTNLDDFATKSRGLVNVVRHIATDDGYKVTQIFDRLCEAIVLLAAMFTVAWMQRNNEQVPLLSAGVSTRRIVRPVLICAFLMLGLAVLNQELVIPSIGDRLVQDRDDPVGQKEVLVHGAYEPNGVHLEGERAQAQTQMVRVLRVTIPEGPVAENQVHITAREAHFIPGAGPHAGTWELTGCLPAELDTRVDGRLPGSTTRVLEVRDAGRYRLHVTSVDFDALVRNPNWFQLASTRRLYEELQRPESSRLASMAVLFHTRLTRPLLGMVLVLMGLSVILRDQNRNVIISSGMCLVLCGAFFAACYACKMLGDNELVAPALAAWLPVIGFGPFSLVLFDAVHT